MGGGALSPDASSKLPKLREHLHVFEGWRWLQVLKPSAVLSCNHGNGFVSANNTTTTTTSNYVRMFSNDAKCRRIGTNLAVHIFYTIPSSKIFGLDQPDPLFGEIFLIEQALRAENLRLTMIHTDSHRHKPLHVHMHNFPRASCKVQRGLRHGSVSLPSPTAPTFRPPCGSPQSCHDTDRHI